jgi:hypothetical protein
MGLYKLCGCMAYLYKRYRIQRILTNQVLVPTSVHGSGHGLPRLNEAADDDSESYACAAFSWNVRWQGNGISAR